MNFEGSLTRVPHDERNCLRQAADGVDHTAIRWRDDLQAIPEQRGGPQPEEGEEDDEDASDERRGRN